MKVLLDTHVWLWSVVSPERITPEVRDVLENPDNAPTSTSSADNVFFHDKPPVNGRQLTADDMAACRVAQLPDHHRDPFDRLLVAVAQLESLTLVTTDPALERLRRSTPDDVTAGCSVAIFGLATPNFWLGLMVLIFPGFSWGWTRH